MKKIYRLSRKKKVAGICAGISDMFSLDPTVVRLAFIFVTVITGIWPLVITYLVGWYLIPDKDQLDDGDVQPKDDMQ